MKKIKININRNPISSQEIGAMQNFGSVLKGTQAIALPFYKKWWFMGSAGVAIIVSIIVAVFTFNNSKPNAQVAAPLAPAITIAKTQQKAFIQPAFKGFDVDFTSFWVQSGKGKKITMPSGTIIKIPACHFTYKSGETVMGDVEIRYREMNDPVDFAVSGIPMTYDSAGQKYTFESAGMFEVQGWKNGQQVLINPECPITIEQKTVSTNGKFNMYYLDTTKRNWEFIGKPNWTKDEGGELEVPTKALRNSTLDSGINISYPVYVNDSLNNILIDIWKEIRELEKNLPKSPVRGDSAKQNFTIEFDAVQFPEFTPFSNVTFGVVDERLFTPALYKYKWNAASISPVANGGGGYVIMLNNATYIGNKTTIDGGIKYFDSERDYLWYMRTWRRIQKFFGKKFPKSSKEEQKTQTIRSSKMITSTPKTFRLIPVDSSQYFYQRSDYRSPVSFKVFPVLSEEKYQLAKANFDKKMKKYKELLQEKKKREKELRNAIKKKKREMRDNWAKQLIRQQEDAKKSVDERSTSYSSIRNSFVASRFGIFNTDYPTRMTNAKKVKIDFVDELGKETYVNNAYLVISNRNVLMANYYNRCCNNTLIYTNNDDNMLFVVFPDERVGVLKNSGFVDLKRKNKIILEMSKKPITTTGELKTYLGITKNTSLQ